MVKNTIYPFLRELEEWNTVGKEKKGWVTIGMRGRHWNYYSACVWWGQGVIVLEVGGREQSGDKTLA